MEFDFKLLEELQDLDLKIEKMEEEKSNLLEFSEVKELEKELRHLKTLFEEKGNQHGKENLKLKKLEGELDLLEIKIQKEEKRLYNGTVSNPKELSSLEGEVKLLKAKKDFMETELLIQMDKVDALTKEQNDLSLKVSEYTQKIKEMEEELKRKLEEVEKSLNAFKGSKSEITPKIPDEILKAYNNLRGKKSGRVVVDLEDGVCQGCFMALPAEKVDKMILQKEKLWFCPHCQRILIVK